MKNKEIFFQVAHNDFLGGNIGCAGLLIVDDYIKYISTFVEKTKLKLDLILLNNVAFNRLGEDLLGNSKYKISDTFKTEVMFIS